MTANVAEPGPHYRSNAVTASQYTEWNWVGMEAQSRKYTRNKLLFREKEVSLRGSPGTSAALVVPFHFHTSL